MSDLSNLESEIIIDFDKILFREAVNCLYAKTYRAGYIVAWISIVESLKRKINILSNTGDIQSRQSFEKIEKLEKDEKSADIQIVTEALKISLIEPDEHKKLEFFWNQRCLFAHPYEKEPKEDELIFIIKQSLDITLSKKLEFKKNYINELIENLVNKPHFLSNDNEVIESYAKNTIPKINKDLHSYFYKSLINKIGEIKDDETKKIYLKRLRIFSVNLLKSTNQTFNDTKWRMEDLALNYTYEFVLGTCDYRIWKKIPKRAKDLTLQYIIQNKNSSAKHHTLILLGKILKKGLFDKSFESKFNEYVSTLEIVEAYEFYKNESTLYDRFILELNSGDFYRQQGTIRILKTDFGQDFQEKIDSIQSIEIGRRIVKAAENGCYEAKDVLNNIDYRFSNNIKKGFIAGIFIDKDYSFRYDDDILFKFFNYINDAELETLETIKEYISKNKNVVKEEHSFQRYSLSKFKNMIIRITSLNKYEKKIIEFLESIYKEFE